MRSAEWYRRPGMATRYHIVGPRLRSGCGVPFLNAFTTVTASSVPEGLRCRRRGCAGLFAPSPARQSPNTEPDDQP